MSEFDVVIVGSGAGGAPVACRLAEAGARVLLVERGRAMAREEFADHDELEWCRRDRFIPAPHTDPHTRRGAVDEPAVRTSDGWISTVLGGGTVHMASYLLRGHREDALQGSRCRGEAPSTALDWAVPFDDVARLYPQVERELGVVHAPGSDLPPLRDHALGRKLDRAAAALGVPSMPTPRGILTAARPDEDRGACDYHDLCASYGCPTDARASMPSTYLRRAQKTNNLTVWTESLALRVEKRAGERSAAGVVVRRLRDGGEQLVKAGVVVVACGAVESARLLLLSGFDGPALGKNLWFSLCVEVSGFFDARDHGDVEDLMAGSPFLNRAVHFGGFLDEAEQARAGVDRTGMFAAAFAHENPIHRAERAAVEGRLLWGRALKEELVRIFHRGRTVVLEGFAESLPHAGAFVDLDPDVKDQHGLPVARITHAHHARDVKVAAAQAKEGVELLRAMGAVDVHVTRAPSETDVLQGGTCRFGDDPAHSVVDVTGRVHGYDNVFVPDGGALPSSLACPVTLTIVANSLRTAEHVLAELRGTVAAPRCRGRRRRRARSCPA